MKNWFRRFFAGIGIGVAAAIPGVSAGAIAVILKVYEVIINAASDIIKHFKNAVLILLPVVLGAILAVIPTIYIMDKALNNLLFAVVVLFVGFIIGSFPGITDEIKGEKATKKDIIILSICFLVPVAIGLVSFFVGDQIKLDEQIKNPQWYMYFVAVAIGIIAAAGFIVPGISGSMILLITGFYTPFITGVTEFVRVLFKQQEGVLNWKFVGIIICFAVGAVIGCILLSKLMKFLINKNRKSTFFGIIGFVAGSVISLFVNYDMKKYYSTWGCVAWYYEVIIAIGFLLVGIALAYLLLKQQRKYKALK